MFKHSARVAQDATPEQKAAAANLTPEQRAEVARIREADKAARIAANKIAEIEQNPDVDSDHAVVDPSSISEARRACR